jgi:hypothetical protein
VSASFLRPRFPIPSSLVSVPRPSLYPSLFILSESGVHFLGAGLATGWASAGFLGSDTGSVLGSHLSPSLSILGARAPTTLQNVKVGRRNCQTGPPGLLLLPGLPTTPHPAPTLASLPPVAQCAEEERNSTGETCSLPRSCECQKIFALLKSP